MSKIHVLQVTKDCNQDCFYCCRDISIKNKPFDEIKRDLESLVYVDQVIITGGEPTLRSDLPKIIAHARNFAGNVHLQTNGINFSDMDYCRNIIRAGIGSVLVAFPSFDSNICEKITNTENVLDKKLEGLRNLAKFVDLKTGVVFVPSKLNYREFPNYVKRIAKISRDIYIQVSYTVRYDDKIGNKVNDMVMYSDLRDFINKGAGICRLKNIEIRFDGIPLCFIPKYTRFASDLKTRNYDFVEDFIGENRKEYDSDNYLGKEHLMTNECSSCRFCNICRGVYSHYVEVFGDREIKAIK